MKNPWLKKLIFTVVIVALVIVSIVFIWHKVYNRQLIDLTYSYDYAIILMPDGSVVKGKVQSWTDFEDGDQIQVKIDGKTYLTHSMNVVMIKD
jgi:hypothetical protein